MSIHEVALWTLAAVAVLQGMWLAVAWGRLETLGRVVLVLQRRTLREMGITSPMSDDEARRLLTQRHR